MKKSLFLIFMVFAAFSLFAVPLETGYSIAPTRSASADERARAYLEARNRVINASAKYLNTPYRYGGITASGLDCSGFIYISFKDALGVSLPRSSTGLHSWTDSISIDKAQPGDLLFFKTDSSGNISHVGLYLGGRNFIHSASAGPHTGVIYSNLDETYWNRTFAGAGRVFPEIPAGYSVNNAHVTNAAGTGGHPRLGPPDISPPAISSEGTGSGAANSGRLLVGVAIAPTWCAFLKDGNLVRGFASHIRIAADTYSLGPRMIFGLEFRPEYDGALGVFRLPITLSWGVNDQIRIFGGPVFSYGDTSLSTEDGKRQYSGGTSWFGTIGLTAAPFIYSSEAGEFAPYMELAWQSYYTQSAGRNINADFSAGFRFSTGVRWTLQVN
jgi:probable lipoprotein NlpC